jgi:predicted glycosyltransferase
MRAKKLARLGFVRVIDRPSVELLKPEIESILEKGYSRPGVRINLNGAAITAKLIEKLAARTE